MIKTGKIFSKGEIRMKRKIIWISILIMFIIGTNMFVYADSVDYAVELSQYTYVYDGKEKKPTVKVYEIDDRRTRFNFG